MWELGERFSQKPWQIRTFWTSHCKDNRLNCGVGGSKCFSIDFMASLWRHQAWEFVLPILRKCHYFKAIFHQEDSVLAQIWSISCERESIELSEYLPENLIIFFVPRDNRDWILYFFKVNFWKCQNRGNKNLRPISSSGCMVLHYYCQEMELWRRLG